MTTEPTMATEETADVVREIRVAATPETIFAYLTDPVRMVRWMGRQATLDPRPGGIYRVDVNGRDVARGQFVEIVPHRRVVFTFGWEAEGSAVPPGSSTVEISLVRDGEATVVRLVHRDLPVETRDIHGDGWEHYLARLAIVGAGGDAGADPLAAPAEGGAAPEMTASSPKKDPRVD